MRFAILFLLFAGCGGGDSTSFINPPSAAVVSITSVSPTTSPTAGGGTLTIQGTLFSSGLSILIGSTSCTSVNVVSSTQVTCVLPAIAASTVSVSVFNTNGTSATSANAIVYADAFGPPAVSSVSPANGSTSGGTAVTITGTSFQTGASVKFNTTLCASTNVVSSTSITCTTPAHAAGVVSVTVTNPDMQTNTLNSAYTYVTPPTYTSLKADVLTARCSSCHGASGGFSTQIYSQIFSRVSAGNPSASLLYQRVANDSMPTSGGALTATQKQKIFDWILDGAQNN